MGIGSIADVQWLVLISYRDRSLVLSPLRGYLVDAHRGQWLAPLATNERHSVAKTHVLVLPVPNWATVPSKAISAFANR